MKNQASIQYYRKIEALLQEFEEEVLYKKRFRSNHAFLQEIQSFQEDCTILVPQGAVYFRARLCEKSFLRETGLDMYGHCLHECGHCDTPFCVNRPDMNAPFYGYDESGSLVAADRNKIKSGRANPQLVPVLYVSQDSYTALSEVKPIRDSFVSIAKIQALEELKIYDISYPREQEYTNLYLFKQNLFDLFSRVVSELKDYIVTQYISEYIQEIGFDGIRYNSSINPEGFNFAIFYPEKCRAISSEIQQVQGIRYQTEIIYPKQQRPLL